MECCLNIVSRLDLTEIGGYMTEIVSETADFVHFGEDGRYFLFVKAHSKIPRDKVAECIGEWIVGNYETQILNDLLDANFESFDDRERKIIISSAVQRLDGVRRNLCLKAVVAEISGFLCDEENLYIDGFVKFRLQEYRRELDRILSDTVDEFLCKKEYDEFIFLLTAYIDTHEALIDLVHIVQEEDGAYSLFDFRNRRIKIECETPAEYLEELFLSEDDRLLGILMTLIPKRIIWHKNSKIKNNKTMKTIERIFGNRFSVCRGCDRCDDFSE